jgi:CheY-like chemotaxis protein
MKILVVDDEKDIQPLFEQRFRKEIRNGEIEFVFAHSGEDALNLNNS